MSAFYGVAAALCLLACSVDAALRYHMPHTKVQLVARDIARAYALYLLLIVLAHLAVAFVLRR